MEDAGELEGETGVGLIGLVTVMQNTISLIEVNI